MGFSLEGDMSFIAPLYKILVQSAETSSFKLVNYRWNW